MPIPKWCDKKSIRTVTRGKTRILICCPKGKTKAGRCSVGTRAIDVRSPKLGKGARQEKREHPWASGSIARRIASDHLRENPKAYGETVLPRRLNGQRGFDHPHGGRILVMRAGSKGYNIWHREAKWGPHDATTTKKIIAALRAGKL